MENFKQCTKRNIWLLFIW